ncbi:putative NAD-binding protein [Balamuthia mandrillaris]
MQATGTMATSVTTNDMSAVGLDGGGSCWLCSWTSVVAVLVSLLAVALGVGYVAAWQQARRLSRVASRRLEPGKPKRKARVAVIGGGIAGCGCAWSLARSGFHVELFEVRDKLGGNAKTQVWQKEPRYMETGLSVLAWPEAYFKNYEELLRTLEVPFEEVRLRFFVESEGEGVVAHDKETELMERLKGDFARWGRMVATVRYVNNALNSSSKNPSLYDFSLLNPFNVVPMRVLARLFGVSTRFWQAVVIPIYSSTFLTVKLDWIPSVIVPVIDDLISVSKTSVMNTWSTSSAQVFAELTRSVRVHPAVQVQGLRSTPAGELSLFFRYIDSNEGDATTATFDHVVMACPADVALRLQPSEGDSSSSASWMHSLLLNNVGYADDDDNSFMEGIIHSDASVLPTKHREELLANYANYIRMEGPRCENTFIVGSWVPSVQQYNDRFPMLITYNSKNPGAIRNPVGTVSNLRAHPHLSTRNLALALLLRFIQGRNGVFYCGSFATPGNGHDLSFLSGLVVAHALGAPYPFPHNKPAQVDFEKLRKLMGFSC